MEPAAKKFFQQILETPSPSGYEEPVQRIVREYAGGFAHQVRTDLHGNVIAAVNPGAKLRVMFAGHADQIGLIVTFINEQGFIYTNPIGGWDPQQLIGQRMTIHTAKGPVPAVIARKPIHVLDEEERKQVVKLKDMWLDIGAKTQQEAAEAVARRRRGDARAGLPGNAQRLRQLPGHGQQDRPVGGFEAARRAAKKKLNVSLFAVATVQEEIGLRGAHTSAFGIDPQVGIAVDVTHATDCPTMDKNAERRSQARRRSRHLPAGPT